ncbi:MAG: Crp/Fnr family transcriptional regulator [Bacteroidales bacterium]
MNDESPGNLAPGMRTYLPALAELGDELLEVFLSRFRPVAYRKGDYFVREGQTSRYIAFILRGCLMCVYNKDGKELIDEFSFENEFISDYRSFVTGAPADKDILCLEDCELLVLGYESLQELYATHPGMERGGRLIAEMLLFQWQVRVKSFLLDDAETRYRNLLETRPSLFQRVPQYLIAQYLAVSPETLSRIRKKIVLDAPPDRS